MRLIIVIMLMLMMNSKYTLAQERNFEKTQVIKEFLTSVFNGESVHKELINKYLSLSPIEDSSKRKERDQMIDLGLSSLNAEMLDKNISVDKLKILRYEEVDKKDQVIMGQDHDNVFIVYHKGSPFMYFLMSQEKVASFTTVKKGSHKIFLIY